MVVEYRRRAIGSDVAALLVLKVRRARPPWAARITRGRYKERPAAVNAERCRRPGLHDPHVRCRRARRSLDSLPDPAAESLGHLDANEIRGVLGERVRICMAISRKESCYSAMGTQGQKKSRRGGMPVRHSTTSAYSLNRAPRRGRAALYPVHPTTSSQVCLGVSFRTFKLH